MLPAEAEPPLKIFYVARKARGFPQCPAAQPPTSAPIQRAFAQSAISRHRNYAKPVLVKYSSLRSSLVARCRAQVRLISRGRERAEVKKRAAAENTLLSATWTLWIGGRTVAIVVGVVPILTVLSNVTVHVEQAPGIRVKMPDRVNALV